MSVFTPEAASRLPGPEWLRSRRAAAAERFGALELPTEAEEVCQRLGLPVLTNAVDWARGALKFPNLDRCCACSSCGTCKQAPIKEARRRGRTCSPRLPWGRSRERT